MSDQEEDSVWSSGTEDDLSTTNIKAIVSEVVDKIRHQRRKNQDDEDWEGETNGDYDEDDDGEGYGNWDWLWEEDLEFEPLEYNWVRVVDGPPEVWDAYNYLGGKILRQEDPTAAFEDLGAFMNEDVERGDSQGYPVACTNCWNASANGYNGYQTQKFCYEMGHCAPCTDLVRKRMKKTGHKTGPINHRNGRRRIQRRTVLPNRKIP